MPSRLNPYISFDGNAREALEFYEGVFGGTLSVHTFGELGGEDGPGADKIMHGMLETADGLTLMAADMPPGTEHEPGNNVAVSLSGHDADELRGYWEKLSGGGTVSVPLEMQMWGDEFGMCVDPFGITLVGQHRTAAGLIVLEGAARRHSVRSPRFSMRACGCASAAWRISAARGA